MNNLDRMSIYSRKSGPEYFMAPYDFAEALLERCDIEQAGEAERCLKLVGSILRLQLLDKPHPFLLKREGRIAFPRKGLDGKRLHALLRPASYLDLLG